MIQAIGASLTYADGTEALKPFDLSVQKGELVYITGPSGSGKTSLLKLILGTAFVTTGSFEVLGHSMLAQKEAEIRLMRQQVGPVFQEFRLLKGRSVLDNVMLGMRFIGIAHHDMKVQALQSIEEVGLAHKTHQPVDRLSWGECQRVAIARAVARKPRLILADEPTGNLDHDNAVNILSLLASYRTTETCVIITTHATHLIAPDQKGVFITMEAGVARVERRVDHG